MEKAVDVKEKEKTITIYETNDPAVLSELFSFGRLRELMGKLPDVNTPFKVEEVTRIKVTMDRVIDIEGYRCDTEVVIETKTKEINMSTGDRQVKLGGRVYTEGEVADNVKEVCRVIGIFIDVNSRLFDKSEK